MLALIIARVVRPGSELATTTWWTDTTMAADLDIAGASTCDVYGAMDWLAERQEAIETKLARRNPALAAERARKRTVLLDATDADLDKIKESVAAGRLTGSDRIGIRVGKSSTATR